MFIIEKWLKHRETAKRISALRHNIDYVWREHHVNVETPEDKLVAFQLSSAATEEDRNELEYLEQESTIAAAQRWGIELDSKCFKDNPYPLRQTLRPESFMRARQELREKRLAFVKEVSSIVLPILSLVVAILALLHKHG
jgi:hypothetical protein